MQWKFSGNSGSPLEVLHFFPFLPVGMERQFKSIVQRFHFQPTRRARTHVIHITPALLTNQIAALPLTGKIAPFDMKISGISTEKFR